MNKKKINPDYLLSFALELESKFRRINTLSTKSKEIIGDYHEFILREMLKNFTSKRFCVKTGHILCDGELSNQIDILIIDEYYPVSYIFQMGDYAIVRPECVACIIEVKTRINPKEFELAFKNIYRAKEVNSLALKFNIPRFIFIYDSPETTNSKLEEYFSENKYIQIKDVPKPEFWPNFIFTLNKDMLILDKKANYSNDKKERYFRLVKFKNEDESEKEFKKRNKAFKISTFLSLIVGSLAQQEIRTSGRNQGVKTDFIIDSDDMKLGADGFRIGEKAITDQHDKNK